MIVLYPDQIESLQHGLEPNGAVRWHQMTDDAGVHAMRVRLDAEGPERTYSICAPRPDVQKCADAPFGAPVVEWEVHHGNVHYGAGALIVAQVQYDDVSMEITGAGGERRTPYPFSIDLMRPYQPCDGSWVPFDFGVFTDLLPLTIRFELTSLLPLAAQTFDFFLIARIAPPHRRNGYRG